MHDGAMKRRLALLSALALATCVALTSACATAVTSTPSLRLVVRIDLGVGIWEQWSLQCGPTTGTHPNRAAACKTLLATSGRTLLAPVPGGVACSMLYGGPERATISGVWNGKRVSSAFSRTNGCEIARWEKARALFTVPGKSIVRGAVSLSPTCPVQQVGQTCENPSAAAIVTFTGNGKVIHARAVADKGFALRLARGRWTATADAGMSCPTVDVTVPSPMLSALVIACDTGIR